MTTTPKAAPPPAGKLYDIPSVSFRIITDDKSLLGPAGVHSDQARSYGYNDFSDFERSEHYIRYIEPIESELAVQVEYDMDEQDQEWLDVVNAERRKDQAVPVSYEMFEIIMDKLEKEWFNLIKRIPQPVSHLPVEDSKCAICDDGEGENSNAIVFCDGCNLAVHQDCYGVPYIPEGQWLCRKCTVSPENPVSCLFCPNEGGAFKQTTTGHWSHLLCAIWIPELSVGNSVYMEPVEGVEMVPKSRWKLNCSLCKERVGACIQCENKNCFTAFHVTCARQMGFLMSMKLMGADGQLRAYCDKHVPAEWRENREEDTDDNDDESYQDTVTEDEFEDEMLMETPVPKKRGRPRKNSTTVKTVTPKTARAHAKSYRPGPPIVPRLIVNKLLDYIAKVNFRKKQQFVERLCRYWSLKREARRGAPLLKRLHLEPWTATSESREQTEAQKAKKLEFLVALRNDLEKVRLLAELVRKREKEKLRQALVIQEIVDNFIFPHYITLREALAKIIPMDRSELFLHPVSKEEVPDYYDVIKEPMTWTQIEERLDKMMYLSTDAFKRDILLVLDNAMVYNKSETPFHRAASRIKKNVQPVLDELGLIREQSYILPNGPSNNVELVEPDLTLVGDLEPSLLRLQTFLAPDKSDLSRDILASIFVTEVNNNLEPTPPLRRAPKEKAQPGIRDPTRSTRAAPVAVMDISDASSPVAEAGPSRQRTTRRGPVAPSTPEQPSTPVDLGAKQADADRERGLEARREQQKELREARKEIGLAKKQAKELEKEKKRNKERERRRLKKEALARERGELPPEPSTSGVKEAEEDKEEEGKVEEDKEEEGKVEEDKDEAAKEETEVEKAESGDVEKNAKEDAEVPKDDAEEKDRGADADEELQLDKPEENEQPETNPQEEDDKMDVDEAEPEVEPATEAADDTVEDNDPDSKSDAKLGDKAEEEVAVEPTETVDQPPSENTSTEEDKPAEEPVEDKHVADGPNEDASTSAAETTADDASAEPPRGGEASVVLPQGNELSENAPANPLVSSDCLTPPSSPGTIKPKAKRERGVLGLQSVPVLSDRERREQERQLDLVTTTVDPLDEYRRFNVGWILPAGSKRRRVAPPPPPITVPPPRRANRTSKTPSISESVSVKSDRKGKGRASTPPEEGQGSSRKRKYNHASSPLSGVDDDDLTPIPESAQPSADKDVFPAMARSSLSPPPQAPSDAPSGAPDDTPRPAKRAKRITAINGDPFAAGAAVWAKVPSYPYFPAVVVDPIKDRERIPQNVLDLEEEEKSKAPHGRVWLARFYDKLQSWGWVTAEKLHLLGEDEAVDEQFLAGKDRPGAKSVFKSTHVKNSCRAAYEIAKGIKDAEQTR